MAFEGSGCMIELVDEWNKLFEASENTVVIQRQTISGIASMSIGGGEWIVTMGE